jgi:hypothetical protein
MQFTTRGIPIRHVAAIDVDIYALLGSTPTKSNFPSCPDPSSARCQQMCITQLFREGRRSHRKIAENEKHEHPQIALFPRFGYSALETTQLDTQLALHDDLYTLTPPQCRFHAQITTPVVSA